MPSAARLIENELGELQQHLAARLARLRQENPLLEEEPVVPENTTMATGDTEDSESDSSPAPAPPASTAGLPEEGTKAYTANTQPRSPVSTQADPRETRSDPGRLQDTKDESSSDMEVDSAAAGTAALPAEGTSTVPEAAAVRSPTSPAEREAVVAGVLRR